MYEQPAGLRSFTLIIVIDTGESASGTSCINTITIPGFSTWAAANNEGELIVKEGFEGEYYIKFHVTKVS